jgi:gamma-tubulin complex component 3
MDAKLLKQEKKNSQNMTKLARLLLPQGTSILTTTRLAEYCHSIIKLTRPKKPNLTNSTMASFHLSSRGLKTPASVKVTKQIMKLSQNKTRKEMDQISLKVQNNFSKLSKISVLKKKSSVLELLLRLSIDQQKMKRENILYMREILTKGKTVMMRAVPPKEELRVSGAMDVEIGAGVEEEKELSGTVNDELLSGLIQLYKCGKSPYIGLDENGFYGLRINLKVKPFVRKLVLNLAEFCKEVNFLRKFLEEFQRVKDDKDLYGNLVQSMTKRAAMEKLEEILKNFDRLLNSIEKEKANKELEYGLKISEKEEIKYFSMVNFYNLMQEPIQKMTNFAIVFHSIYALNNSHILSALSCYSDSTGNERLRLCAKSLLKSTILPFRNFLLRWLNEGKVDDPNREFFIREKNKKKVKIWENDCELMESMIPRLMDSETAEIAFNIGMVMRRIEEFKLDVQFEKAKYGEMEIEGENKNFIEFLKETDLDFVNKNYLEIKGILYDHYCRLAKLSAEAYMKQTKLLRVLDFLHRTFFMKNGDFFDSMIHSLDAILKKDANQVHFHEVMPVFRSISQKSSIGQLGLNRRLKRRRKFEADLLDNFGVKFLQKSAGDRGWDVFSLEFKFDQTLTFLFTENFQLSMLRISHFILKLRRLYYKMNEIWLWQKQVLKAEDVTQAAYKLVTKCNIIRTHMTQFITNINSYVFYEVIASEYQTLEKNLNTSQNFEQLRISLKTFLENLLQKSFLTASTQKSNTTPNINKYLRTSKKGASTVQKSIVGLLNHVEKFIKAFNKIYSKLYDGNGDMNKYFPITPSSKMIAEIWAEYETDYYQFLELIEEEKNFSSLGVSGFKFDFNFFHVNRNELRMGKIYYEQLEMQRRAHQFVDLGMD